MSWSLAYVIYSRNDIQVLVEVQSVLLLCGEVMLFDFDVVLQTLQIACIEYRK